MYLKKNIVLSLLLIMSINGCSKNEVIEPKEQIQKNEEKVSKEQFQEAEEIEKAPYDSTDLTQYDIIYNQRSVWEIKDSTIKSSYGELIEYEDYGNAITDLDGDGYLEIIVSGWAGTGHFSTNKIFECTEDNRLQEWNLDNFAYDYSEPDLLLQNEIDGLHSDSSIENIVIFRDKDEMSFLILKDKEFWGAEGGETCYFKVTINDNALSSQLLGYKQENVNDGLYFYDSSENLISKEEFDSLLKESYVGAKKSNLSLKWFYDVTAENIEDSYNQNKCQD
ncbi:hypothetical protein SAMN02910298_00972 [Pseudobutyrivibrio sp. YE44]|uniref:hypothetical protein n=1 Tax=Pseudobutyrivibrio sp. YE44 TaxID=1520802 RepID=UPI0008866491|nr:hypothetical protein [Pseudobutyrivibrio sp. YE44]SDB20621.1 hypothetical protein SAMN02910298_00972 [Pseudobutyrivibrio sp. YE44]